MAEEGTEMFGDDAVAYINKGSEDGIQTGQTYAIYDEYPVGAELDFVDYGSLLVLHTEATTATVLITSLGQKHSAARIFPKPAVFLIRKRHKHGTRSRDSDFLFHIHCQ